jgi:hypothetical protein
MYPIEYSIQQIIHVTIIKHPTTIGPYSEWPTAQIPSATPSIHCANIVATHSESHEFVS